MTTGVRFSRLFDPWQIGDVVVPNRIVNPTHGTALELERDIEYLRARARGGAGLLGLHSSEGVSGYTVGSAPESKSPGFDSQGIYALGAAGIAYYDSISIPNLERRAIAIHEEGARCFAQVYHPGAGRHSWILAPTVAPSTVADPYEARIPHALTDGEVEELVWSFAHQIRRIHEAGVDAAELHGAHGYLINQFLSPAANLRSDRWGGDRPRRIAFALAIIEAARTMVPASFPIGIRVGVDVDASGRGITIDELVAVSSMLAPHVAYISVSGGSYAGFGDGPEPAYVSPWYRAPAFNAEAAAAVSKAVAVPVIVTGRVADLSIAAGLISDGVCDAVGMVRALIADPELPRKEREGRSSEVRMCLGLSECHAIGPHRTPVTCAVNAAAGREVELQLKRTSRSRTVVVIGAGPAGMEAARVAAIRGHTVYLADSSRTIGGVPAVLARDDNRRNLRDQVSYFDAELRRLGVELMLDNRVTADEMVDFAPDVVIVATGGVPIVPSVPGITRPHVYGALDVLRGAEVSGRVVVIGGLDKHLGPPTVAEFLKDQGCEVDLVSEHLDFAANVEHGTRIMLAERLARKSVQVLQRTKVTAVEDGLIRLVETFSRKESVVEANAVVVACGMSPNDQLANELRGLVPEIHVVGDALAPRRIMHATLEGARAGNAL